MRPSTSMQAQLRPISPSPPRKTIRTGEVEPPDRFADFAADFAGLARSAGAERSDFSAAPSTAPADLDFRRRPDPPEPPPPEPLPPPEPPEPDPAPDPVSPRALRDRRASGNRLPSLEERGHAGHHGAGLVVEGLRARRVGQPALADGESECPAGGLDRYRIGVLVGGLEAV